MNNKKVNWLFLSIVIIEVVVVLFLSFFYEYVQIGIIDNFIISQLMLVVPAGFFWMCSKKKEGTSFSWKGMKPTTWLMILVFTYLTMPLSTFLNAISMLFTDNVVASMSDSIIALTLPVAFFFMAIWGPVCEELVFRGVVHSGYRNSGNAFQAMIWSALLFGLAHMNLNQAPYAFCIGIMLVLLKEATGSIWAPIAYHVIFNGHNTITLFLSNAFLSDSALPEEILTTETLLPTIWVLAMVALITTSLAVCTLVWIAGNEGRKRSLLQLWNGRKEAKGQMLTVPLVFAFVICVGFMVYRL